MSLVWVCISRSSVRSFSVPEFRNKSTGRGGAGNLFQNGCVVAYIYELSGIIHGGFLLDLFDYGGFGVGGAVHGVDVHDVRGKEGEVGGEGSDCR